jgi:hypothetical protein
MIPTAATAAQIVTHLAGLDAAGLAEELTTLARQMHVHDLVVEISPARGFRIVREGNTAHGILAARHQLIGILVCLAALDPLLGAGAFWKEVLS